MDAVSGDIILRAPQGKIRIEAQDIELVANGYNGRTGYIALDSNEKLILKSKSVDIRATETARFFSENKLDVIGNAIMNIYGGLVDMADGATSILGSKTGPSSTEEKAKNLKAIGGNMHFSDVEVGKQLIVGNGTYYDTLGLGRKAIRGSAYIEGPFLSRRCQIIWWCICNHYDC